MNDKILHGNIVDWNWTRDYGIVRMDDGKELFLHYAHVKIKAKDKDGKLIKLKLQDNGHAALNEEKDSFVRAKDSDPPDKVQQIYGRPAAKGFLDKNGNEIEMKKNQIWFDIGEKVYFTTREEYPNVCFDTTLSYKDTENHIKEQ